MRKLKVFSICLLALLLSACGAGDKSAIVGVLDMRSQALQHKDIQAYRALIADDYQDGRRDKSAVVAEMAQLLGQFDAIRMDAHSRVIRVLSEDAAECEQSYTLKVQKDGMWRNVTRREQLLLRKQDGHWCIASGL